MTITYRLVKGSPLTFAEEDGNFAELAARTDLSWAQFSSEPQVREGTANAPSLEVFRDGLYEWSYPNAQLAQSYITFDVPFDWAPGTDLYVGLHWSPGNSSATGNVRFGVEFTYAFSYGPNGASSRFGPSQTIYINANQADGVAYTSYTNFNSYADRFPGALVQQNMRFLTRIFRDGANVGDTFGAPIFLIGADFFYQTNRFGTQSLTPPFV
jgi:hypothetical protein